MGKSRKIVRSLQATLAYAAVSALATVGAVTLITDAREVAAWLAAAALLLVALLFGSAAAWATWRAACPACDGRLAFSARHGVVKRCLRCGAGVESRGGRAFAVRAEQARAHTYFEQ
jgi:hypothetical protein